VACWPVAKALAFRIVVHRDEDSLVPLRHNTTSSQLDRSRNRLGGCTAFGLIVDFLKEGEFESCVNTTDVNTTCLYIFFHRNFK